MLTKMAALVKSTTGGQLAIGYLPGIVSLELNDPSALIDLKATGLPVISFFDTLQNYRQGDSSRLSYKYEWHYNRTVHALIGDELYERLRTNGLISTSSQTQSVLLTKKGAEHRRHSTP